MKRWKYSRSLLVPVVALLLWTANGCLFPADGYHLSYDKVAQNLTVTFLFTEQPSLIVSHINGTAVDPTSATYYADMTAATHFSAQGRDGATYAASCAVINNATHQTRCHITGLSQEKICATAATITIKAKSADNAYTAPLAAGIAPYDTNSDGTVDTSITSTFGLSSPAIPLSGTTDCSTVASGSGGGPAHDTTNAALLLQQQQAAERARLLQVDTDGDGLVDQLDSCVNQAEVLDPATGQAVDGNYDGCPTTITDPATHIAPVGHGGRFAGADGPALAHNRVIAADGGCTFTSMETTASWGFIFIFFWFSGRSFLRRRQQ